MKLYKKFSLFALFVFLFVAFSFTSSVNAEEAKTNNAVVLAEVNVQDGVITKAEGNTFHINFSLNNGKGLQTGVKYSVKLMQENAGKLNLIDQKVYPQSLTLNENSKNPVSIVYTAPSILSGKYSLYIESNNESGFPFGVLPLGDITLVKSVKGIEIIPNSCSLSVVGEKGAPSYTLLQGVDISSNENLKINCKVKNEIDASVDATPMYETTHRSAYGDIMYASGGDVAPITFSALSTKDVSLVLPKAAKAQSYNVRVWFKTGDTYSNSVTAHYVVRGASATIQNLSLDKDYYNKGDNAQLSFIWTPSADGFYGSRGSVSGLKNISLSASIVDKSGKSCSDPINQKLDNNGNIQVKIPVAINMDCFNPSISTAITDESGQILDQKEFKVSTTSKSDIDYLVMILIGLALVFIIVFVLLKNKPTTPENTFGKPIKTMLFFFVLLASFGLMSHQASANTMSISGQHYNPATGGYETASGAITVNINKSSYSPSESISASWSFQYLNCSNGENSTAQMFKSAAAVSASINGQSKDLPNNGNGSGSGSFKAENVAGSYSADFSGSVYESSGYTSIPYTVVSNNPDPTVSLSASPSSITSGQSSNLSWSSSNATSCTGSGFSANGTSGSSSVSPTSTTSYSVTCYNSSGVGKTANASVSVGSSGGGNLPYVSLSANPTNVAYSGYASTLTWSSNNASSCSGSGFSPASLNGNTVVYPTATTTYSFTCINGSGNSTAYATVTVGGSGGATPPTVSASANPSSIAVGASSTVSWTSTNAVSCYKSKVVTGTGGTIDEGGNGTSGSFSTGSLTETTSYSIQCTGTGGTASKEVTVTVGGAAGAPTASISANPTSVTSGSGTTITWGSTNATSCTRKITAPTTSTLQSNGPISGSFITGNLTVDTTYKVDCKNSSNVHATAEVTVPIVAAAVPSGTISATDCVIALNASTCVSNVTWSTSNVVFPQSVAVTRNNPDYTSVTTGGSGTNFANSVKYGPSTYYVYYGSELLAQTTVNASGSNCASGSTWNGTKCAANPTGTITAASNSCNITSGSTCNISFSWSTTNPLSGVTSSVYKDGSNTAVGTGNNSNGTNFAIPYGGGVYRLMHNNVELARDTVNAKCANNKAWNGSTCVSYAWSGSITASNSCTVANGASTCTVTNFAWTSSGTPATATSIITKDGTVGTLFSGNNSVTNRTVTVSYPSSLFKISNNGNFLNSKNIVAVCASGTSWNGTVCTDAVTMSGNLSSSASSCTIATNASTCNVLLSWTTTNPVATSAVTYYAGTLATGNNSSSNAPIGYGGDDFYLYNNAVELDSVFVDADCIAGTTWNGSKCATNVGPLMTTGLSVTGSPCTIAVGGTSCSVSINWNVTNPIGATELTRDGTGVISTNHTGSTPQTLTYRTISPLTYLSNATFRLSNDDTEYEDVSPYAVCATGSTWNGSMCASTTPPPGGPCTSNCPTSNITLSSTSIFKGKKVDVTWNSTNSSYCVGTNFNTGNAKSGTVSVYPASTTTYTVTCYGTGGNVTFSSASDATIRVQSKILFYEL